jgi:hypothetical protein
MVARSPLWENLLGRSDAVAGEPGRVLLKSWFGPYAVHTGDTVETELPTDWLNYAAVPTREPGGELQPFPEEPSLAFPGDGTWDLRNVGDRLMSWRLWAPHLNQLPESTRHHLLNRLNVPTAEEWRRDIRTETETVNGARWARHGDLWEAIGDVAYDYDWYNGLALSGLAKACECSEPELADAARALAGDCRDIRADMIRYFEIYHDWRLGMAWSDTFGTLWNLDCGHNGLEGLLGEIRLRLLDPDPEGAERVAYLAAKTGTTILATYYLTDWLRENSFQPGDVPLTGSSLSIKGAYPAVRWAFYRPEARNPYPLPRRSPQFSALLKLHGPREQLTELLRTWEEDLPIRYTDWRALYVNPPPEIQEIYRRTAVDANPDPGGVESGEFAISMHHIQPEILLRTLVFEQDPDEVEALYTHPLQLPEQLLLRAGYQLQRLAPDQQTPGALR